MRKIAIAPTCLVLLLAGLAACSSHPFPTRKEDAHIGASFACLEFDIVYPPTNDKTLPLTDLERAAYIDRAAKWTDDAAAEDTRWSGERRVFDSLATALHSHDTSTVGAAVAKVRMVCDPLDAANGLNP